MDRWRCSECDFLNSPETSFCEVCDARGNVSAILTPLGARDLRALRRALALSDDSEITRLVEGHDLSGLRPGEQVRVTLAQHRVRILDEIRRALAKREHSAVAQAWRELIQLGGTPPADLAGAVREARCLALRGDEPVSPASAAAVRAKQSRSRPASHAHHPIRASRERVAARRTREQAEVEALRKEMASAPTSSLLTRALRLSEAGADVDVDWEALHHLAGRSAATEAFHRVTYDTSADLGHVALAWAQLNALYPDIIADEERHHCTEALRRWGAQLRAHDAATVVTSEAKDK